MSLPWELIAAFGVGLLLLFLAGRLLIVPMKLLWRLCANGVLGGLALFGLNLVGAFVGVQLAVNPFTALIAGCLGLPGVALVYAVGMLA